MGILMSRLDSAIRRLQAQRRLLDQAASDIQSLEGVVLELGLGNGRTYDHLRHVLPNRDIYVFEREVQAHPDCVPEDDHLFLGDVIDGLHRAQKTLRARAVLVHADLGTGDSQASRDFAKNHLSPAIIPLLAEGAQILSDQPLSLPGATQLPLPKGMDADRYHVYRVDGPIEAHKRFHKAA
jgi:hypothetical protein